MENRNWIRRIMAHESGEAVPYNFMFSPPAIAIAREHYGDDLEDALNLPIRMTGTKSIKPLYADPDEYGDTVTDEFGVVWSTGKIDRGSPIGPCLEEADLSDYTFPDSRADYRFSDISGWCQSQEGHFRIVWVGDLWERATFMRGMEDILLDTVLNTAFVEKLLEKLTQHILTTMDILFQQGQFEGIAVSDDYGTQQGLIMSPDQWRSLVKPCLAKIYGKAKDNGRMVFHHSCGNNIPIIPDLIDLGLDILHPIQPETMDVFELKKEFGRDLTFCGGVSTQGLLVKGTPDEIRQEVRKLKNLMGEGGGYILEPGITIQADIPPENMIALIDAARE